MMKNLLIEFVICPIIALVIYGLIWGRHDRL